RQRNLQLFQFVIDIHRARPFSCQTKPHLCFHRKPKRPHVPIELVCTSLQEEQPLLPRRQAPPEFSSLSTKAVARHGSPRHPLAGRDPHISAQWETLARLRALALENPRRYLPLRHLPAARLRALVSALALPPAQRQSHGLFRHTKKRFHRS